MTQQFRIIGDIIWHGRAYPLDIALDISQVDIFRHLMQLTQYPDDPFRNQDDVVLVEREPEPAENLYAPIPDQPANQPPPQPTNQPPTHPPNLLSRFDAFTQLDPHTSDKAKWKKIVDTFPWLAESYIPTSTPAADASTSTPAKPDQAEALPVAAKAAPTTDPMAEDFNRLLTALDEGQTLTNSTGQVVISRVARALGKNAGGSKWDYYVGLSQLLQIYLDQNQNTDDESEAA